MFVLGKNSAIPIFKLLVYVLLIVLPVGLGYLVSLFGIIVGWGSVVLAIGVPVAIASISSLRLGFYALLVYSSMYSMIFIVTKGVVPAGVICEVLLLITLVGLLVRHFMVEKLDWSSLWNPVFIILVIDYCYFVFQAFNPNAQGFNAWFVAFRFATYKFLALFLAFAYFQTKENVNTFLKIVLAFSVLAGVYAIKQEWFGLFSFEESWLHADEKRYKTFVLFGKIRKWSLLTGPTEFGLLMAWACTMALSLVINPVLSAWKRILLAISMPAMALGMLYSGTRTAFAMLPLGLAFYFLLTMNKLKTIIIGLVVVCFFLVIYFGPFYSGPIMRFRTTFKGSDDPSMNVRNVNRQRIQPYIYSHPIGGGPTTTGAPGLQYAPGHPLAGFPPDSGYLKEALERGWVGLLIVMSLHFTTLYVGIRNYFRCTDPLIKSIYAGLISGFFALCVANYAQFAWSAKPMDLILVSTYILMFKLTTFQKNGVQENKA